MKYLDKITVFHRLDPRTKILLSIGCACMIVVLDSPLNLFLLFLAAFACFLAMGPPASYIKAAFKIMAIAFLATMISQGFFYYFEPRTPLLVLLNKDSGPIGRFTGGISLYKEGLTYGMVQSMRLFSAALISMVIVMSTYPSDLVLGLKKLGVPEKIGFMLTVSIRFLPVLTEEAKRIMIAQRLRGLRLKGMRGNFKGFRYLIIPLIIDSLRHARRIALAAEVRGYTGKRTEVRELKFTRLDCALLLAAIVILGAAIKHRFNL
ncbi:MAG: energy-coupling factor transporter transmembrane component T [Deltaproteobacteria bacterium]